MSGSAHFTESNVTEEDMMEAVRYMEWYGVGVEPLTELQDRFRITHPDRDHAITVPWYQLPSMASLLHRMRQQGVEVGAQQRGRTRDAGRQQRKKRKDERAEQKRRAQGTRMRALLEWLRDVLTEEQRSAVCAAAGTALGCDDQHARGETPLGLALIRVRYYLESNDE